MLIGPNVPETFTVCLDVSANPVIFPLQGQRPCGKSFHMDSLTSRKAADRLGVSVQKFHRTVTKHKVNPVFELDGIRGAKFWNPRDIDRLADTLQAEAKAS